MLPSWDLSGSILDVQPQDTPAQAKTYSETLQREISDEINTTTSNEELSPKVQLTNPSQQALDDSINPSTGILS